MTDIQPGKNYSEYLSQFHFASWPMVAMSDSFGQKFVRYELVSRYDCKAIGIAIAGMKAPLEIVSLKFGDFEPEGVKQTPERRIISLNFVPMNFKSGEKATLITDCPFQFLPESIVILTARKR